MEYMVITVDQGDTAGSIAKKYSTTEASLYAHNSPSFFMGERLIVEVRHGMPYTVMPFDTISGIAQKFGVNAQALSAFNGCTRVFLGQTIYIPQSEEA